MAFAPEVHSQSDVSATFPVVPDVSITIFATFHCDDTLVWSVRIEREPVSPESNCPNGCRCKFALCSIAHLLRCLYCFFARRNVDHVPSVFAACRLYSSSLLPLGNHGFFSLQFLANLHLSIADLVGPKHLTQTH